MALKYIRIVANAITYMHSKKMNHLDIKPANIMLRKSDDAPILIDFGLAKQYDSTGDQTSTTPVGISHGYAPIEQYRPGGVATFTPQSDVYALGATLYALLTGQTPPHYSDILEEGLPELPSSVSHVTVTAIEKAMETKKTKRPSSIEEFLALLPDTVKEGNPQNLDNIQVDDSISDKKISDNKKSSIEEPVKPIVQGKPKTEPTRRILEETVILNVPLSNYIPTKEEKPHNETASNVSFNTELQYLDLGLSVKWATKLSGIAKPVMNDDVYKFQMEDGSFIKPNDFIVEHSLPTIKQFEELLERCSWTTFQEDKMHGYKIIGPNGNILMMPLGVLNRYLSAECLKPDCLYYYFLYLGEYTHTLAKGVPTEANIWTVKE
ncbi:MAG: protein kinase [Muribaculaceae bacterium]|nr:protein kinase [Muribaculaceae bacterium]